MILFASRADRYDARILSHTQITPVFLHAGIVHLLLNMLAQWFSCALVERQMGTPKFLIVYFASGIFGFVSLAGSGLPHYQLHS